MHFICGVLISNNCKISKRFFRISVQFTPTNRSIGRFAVCIYRVYMFLFLFFLFYFFFWIFFWVFSFWGSSKRRTAGKQQLNRLNARCRLNSVSNFEVSLGCPQRTMGRRRRCCCCGCCGNVASVGVGSDAMRRRRQRWHQCCQLLIMAAALAGCRRSNEWTKAALFADYIVVAACGFAIRCLPAYNTSEPYGLFELGFGFRLAANDAILILAQSRIN